MGVLWGSGVGSHWTCLGRRLCKHRSWGPSFGFSCFLVRSSQERRVSMSGMMVPLMGSTMIVQVVVSGLSADKITELELRGSF